MRTTNAGLGLAFFAGVGLLALPTAAATPAAPSQSAGEPQSANPTHVLPNPKAEKQVALRQEAWADVLSGEATPQTINGNTVLKVGREPAAARKANRRGAATATQDQYVELSNERTDKVFVFLVEFGDQRHPNYPDQDTRPATAGPARFDGPSLQRDPEARPDDNSTQWRKKYNKKYYKDLYFGEGDTRRLAQELLRAPVLRPLQRRGHGHRLHGRALQPGPLRPQQRLPVRRPTSAATPGTWSRTA